MNTELVFYLDIDGMPSFEAARKSREGSHWLALRIKDATGATANLSYHGTPEQLDEIQEAISRAVGEA